MAPSFARCHVTTKTHPIGTLVRVAILIMGLPLESTICVICTLTGFVISTEETRGFSSSCTLCPIRFHIVEHLFEVSNFLFVIHNFTVLCYFFKVWRPRSDSNRRGQSRRLTRPFQSTTMGLGHI